MGEETLSLIPRLESCYFGAEPFWGRLARVLEYSARKHCPTWAIRVRAFTPDPIRAPGASGSYVDNVQKIGDWCALVDAAPDGTPMLLMDVDTMILRPLDPIWDKAFDIAYTTRPQSCRFPLNAGVIFLRVSDSSRAFLRAWRDENRRMLADADHHRQWRRRYAGINQAALGSLLEQRPALDIRPMPCLEWNCEDATWAIYDPAVTRIVHLKSALRRALFGFGPSKPPFQPLLRVWHALECEANQVLPTSA